MNGGFKIVLVRSAWEVRFNGRRDPDLTCAVRQAVNDKSVSTQRKAIRFLSRFMNFRLRDTEQYDDFISETLSDSRMRLEAILTDLGFKIVFETNRIDGSCYVRRAAGNVSEASVWLAALSRFYSALSRAQLRPKANPIKIDGWHLLTALERLELGAAVLGCKSDVRRYRGSQYIASGIAPSPLRIEDPVGLGPAVLKAGRAFGWPDAIIDLVTVMADDGPRWIDTSPITAADWARSSGFQRTIWAPNKGSNGVRVKEIVISADTVLQIRSSFDRDPARPDMVALETLLAVKDWPALEQVYLFPSKRGVPHTYGVFNNTYIRPALEAAGIMIHSTARSVRPTPHRLRAARIQTEVDHIFGTSRSEDEITADLRQLQADVGIKSEAAFSRYLGEKRRLQTLKGKIERFEERRQRNHSVVAGRQSSTRKNAPAQSRAQKRLRGLT